MRNDISRELIEKYLKGECNPEELEIVLAWYDSFDEDVEGRFLQDPEEYTRLENKMLREIKKDAGISDDKDNRGRSFGKLGMISAISLSVAACLSLIYFIMFWPGNTKTETWNLIRIANHSNQIKKYVFEDSSIVWLKPSTVVYIDKTYNKQARRVRMEGDAFFEVFHNPAKPFIVSAGTVDTKVLGTKFSVRSRSAEDIINVVVASGKVQVDYAEGKGVNGVTLLPGQSAEVIKSTQTLRMHDCKGAEVALWRKKDLFFDNEPVRNVVARLNQCYKANIYYRDRTIGSYHLRADFSDVNLADVLLMLEKSLHVSYVVEDSGIRLQRKPG